MTSAATGRKPRRSLDWIRWLFLLLAVGFAIWGFRDHREDILSALSTISFIQVLSSAMLVLIGLGFTGVLWGWLLRSFGHSITIRESAGFFFVGQIGKYIPGSVWSLAAQADLARSRAIPPRTTVSVGLVFLWVHVISGVPVATLFLQLPMDQPLNQLWIRALGFIGGLLLLMPAVLRRIGALVAGRGAEPALSWRDSGGFMLIMLTVWAIYGAAFFLVAPPEPREASGGFPELFLPLTAAFALSYVMGVIIVLAPAGLGAREAVLIAATAPILGLAPAAAMAIVIRLVHTVCDFTIAGVSWLWLRLGGRPDPPPTQ